MTRRDDLENLIIQSYQLAREYEIIEQTSSDPKELGRASNNIREQKKLLRKYLQEYIDLGNLINFSIKKEFLEIIVFTENKISKSITNDDEVFQKIKSLQQQLANLRKNLLVIQERQSEFIDLRSIPPDLLKAEELIKGKILVIESDLRDLGNA